MNPAPAELLQLLTIAALQPTTSGHSPITQMRFHIAALAGTKRKSRHAWTRSGSAACSFRYAYVHAGL